MNTFAPLKRRWPFVLALLAFGLGPLDAARAQVAPGLGTAKSFAVLAGSTATNIGPTLLSGDLGVSPGTAITGFPPGTVIAGTTHAADAVAAQAQSDTTTAYNALASQACNTTFGVPTDLGGMTLVPGVYCFSSSAQITGALTLNAAGNPDAVWVFKVASTLITASNASVTLVNGAQACNVFWQVGSAATVGTGTSLVGSVLALQSIALGTNARLAGRALARNGAVTMDANLVTVPVCAVPPVTPLAPTIGKAFTPATVNPGAASTLTITLSNPDATIATLSAPLTDTLPAGLLIAGSASTTCGGSLSTGTASVTLTGGAIPASGACTVTVPVSASGGGSYLNALAAGVLQTQNGSNAAPAAATLTVPQPAAAPTLGKAFSPATIPAGGVSTLTITLSNTSATAAFLTAAAPLTDTLPAGLLIAGAASTTCGGAVTTGVASVTLTAGSIPANGACTVTVPVSAAGGGNYLNALPAGALQSGNGSNAAPALATLTVTPPAGGAPALGKAFAPATVPAGGVSVLTLTLSNPNASALALSAPLTDPLPSGLVVAGSASTTCGGPVVTSATSVTLSAGTIPAQGACTVSVPVTAANGGNYLNSLAAGALQTLLGGNTAPAIATLTVASPATIALGKAFSPASIETGATALLTLTLSNTGSSAAKLSAPLTDLLPAGLVIAGTATTTCSNATVLATPGSATLVLKSGSIPAKGACTVTVPVSATLPGSYINSLAAGALKTKLGNNPAPALATLVVTKKVPLLPPGLVKSFSPPTVKAGTASTLTITLKNPNSTPLSLTKALTDNLPSGLTITGTATTTCPGGTFANAPGAPAAASTLSTVTGAGGQTGKPGGAWGGGGGGGGPSHPPAGASSVSLTAGTIPANGTCQIKVQVIAKTKGSYVNTIPAGALQTAKGKNPSPAVATLTVSR